MIRVKWVRIIFYAVAASAVAGCATDYRRSDDVERLFKQGEYVKGLALLEEESNKGKFGSKLDFYMAREASVTKLIQQARAASAHGKFTEAKNYLDEAERIRPSSEAVADEARRLQSARQIVDLLQSAENAVNAGNVTLGLSSLILARNINPNDLKVKERIATFEQRIEAIRRGDFVFARLMNKKVKLKRPGQPASALPVPERNGRISLKIVQPDQLLVNLSLNELVAEIKEAANVDIVLKVDGSQRFLVKSNNENEVDAMELVNAAFSQLHLRTKFSGESTLILYEDSANSVRMPEHQIVRIMRVDHASWRTISSAVKSVGEIDELWADERLNALVVRGSPDAIARAEALSRTLDVPDPEVYLEVDIVEISTGLIEEIGTQFPQIVKLGLMSPDGFSLGAVPLSTLKAASLTNMLRVMIADPFFQVTARERKYRLGYLGNPKLRVKNKENAVIHVGNKVPVITTTATQTSVSESVTYLDTGVKLAVVPRMLSDGEIEIKVTLDVSNITGYTKSASGTNAPQLGTRMAATSLRVRDGEPAIIGGLITQDLNDQTDGLPLLSSTLLFGNFNNSKATNQIVLVITPRIVNNELPLVDRSFDASLTDWVGNELRSQAPANLTNSMPMVVPADHQPPTLGNPFMSPQQQPQYDPNGRGGYGGGGRRG